jgi:hypothetical protein
MGDQPLVVGASRSPAGSLAGEWVGRLATVKDTLMSCLRCQSVIVTSDGTTHLGGQRFRCRHCGRALYLTLRFGILVSRLSTVATGSVMIA